MKDRESQIRSEIKFLISVFNKMHPDAKNYDDMALYDDFKSQYERVLELLTELDCIKKGIHYSKDTLFLKKVFPDKNISNIDSKGEYYSLKVLYDKKNNLMQNLSKMNIVEEEKNKIKDAINSVYSLYIKDQKKREKDERKSIKEHIKNSKIDNIDQIEENSVKYKFDEMSEEERNDFIYNLYKEGLREENKSL